jgi:mannose-1-phosphate guanylyltransferase
VVCQAIRVSSGPSSENPESSDSIEHSQRNVSISYERRYQILMQTVQDDHHSIDKGLNLHLPASHSWAVLLAGGDGVRLRDLTQRIAGDSRPKQFCQIIGQQNLFRQTRSRLDPLFPPDRQVFVLSRAHEIYYRGDLSDSGGSYVMEQPLNRGTGIAILLALLHILQRDPGTAVAFFPCDHFYADDDSFRLTIRSAIRCAEQNTESIILVGAEAKYPEVDYGWIEPGTVVVDSAVGPLAHVERFWEKPPLNQARSLLSRGCLWNTFVTVGRAATFFEMLCSQVPAAVLAISRAMAHDTFDVAYRALATVDFSRDVLANLPHRLLVLCDRTSGWVDLGSPARVHDTLSRNGIQPEWAG